MGQDLRKWKQEAETIFQEFKEQIDPRKNQILVIGCSTSEIIGEKIGTAGSTEVAQVIFDAAQKFREETGVQPVFQCCEHLNRALVMERHVQEKLNFEEVTVVPVPSAGGSMATYAYRHMEDPVVVEHVKADYGIDIGDTFVGMHLKHVAVPVRVSINNIGSAHVTLARTRPKLIGGERAVYRVTEDNTSCH
ncbi:TIGR01440 family protein [Pallidibacillus pasinlerensis]|uniref:UPF0340 protein GW534_00735 n=1 Tax=Pallidibacillus pasinlerensis TaxID=2703818 RepID=A0ABW9ZYR1_9BACI|nr:TIGR01440 family protein [Pallidibacillus pasinlerensis]NCU16302.1 TIGR01440 family protein [Pallidibacillus pasinlerensis]